MRFFTFRGRKQDQAISQIPVEALENRRLLSGSIMPADTTSPVTALAIDAAAGTKFKGEVGIWTTSTGLPAPSSGLKAVATIDWGDGKTSHAKLVDDGSGIIQINASHTWANAGTFQTLINVEEIPKKHAVDIVEIGQATGSAVVTPKPHAIALKGTYTGTYTSPIGNPDAGTSYDFTGSGTSQALGAADISGSISPPGFIRTGAAHGEFILTATSPAPTATGSVTFDVTGHSQNGGGPLPEKLAYDIISGTGDFANVRGKGTISVAIDTAANTFVLVIH